MKNYKGTALTDLPANVEKLNKVDYQKALENLNLDFAKPIVALLVDISNKDLNEKIGKMNSSKGDLEKYIHRKLKSSINV